eukprot:TRINITY_DN26419_c0_g1_i1.p2 TRINITY_DN26419_c0_g1~~TRINITY_DN26419_c0_g1_i1.p2  ORF type:complete len:227 (+),score=63.71 TRINITY_DN26419_c0_g1_i1:85-765(+)
MPGVDLSGGASAAPASSGGFGAGLAASAMNNPNVQDQMKAAAYEHAQHGLAAAREGAGVAAAELNKYIREGPAGISILCFLGGLATSFIGFLGLLNIGGGLTSPFSYVLNVYLTGFGFVAVLLEADTKAMQKMQVIGKFVPLFDRYQAQIFTKANFLTELLGRGLFYFFVGSLAITQCLICPLFLVGLWNVLMGAICILMHCGINPVDHIEQRNSANAGQNVPLAP